MSAGHGVVGHGVRRARLSDGRGVDRRGRRGRRLVRRGAGEEFVELALEGVLGPCRLDPGTPQLVGDEAEHHQPDGDQDLAETADEEPPVARVLRPVELAHLARLVPPVPGRPDLGRRRQDASVRSVSPGRPSLSAIGCDATCRPRRRDPRSTRRMPHRQSAGACRRSIMSSDTPAASLNTDALLHPPRLPSSC